MIFASFILLYFGFMLHMVKDKTTTAYYIALAGVVWNLYCVWGIVMKNPGVPQSIMDRKLKEK